jgi:hypothetical protein
MRTYFIKNKKGEGDSSSHLITWIILIASVLVLLYFLTLLDFTKTIDEQMCHLGILSRGDLGEIKGAIPMTCKTSKICVTRDGGCDEKGRDIERVASKEDIYRLFGNKMADCWWMFGEGKSNFIVQKISDPALYCSLCYDMVFDSSIQSIPGLEGNDKGEDAMKISKIELYRYLEKHEISKNKTYSEYMSLASADFLESNFKSSLPYEGNDVGVTMELREIDVPKIDLNQRQYVLMGVFNRVSVPKSVGFGGLVGFGASAVSTLVASAIISVPTGGVSLLLAVGSLIGAGVELLRVEAIEAKDLEKTNFISTIIEGKSGNYYLTPTIVPAEPNKEGYSDIAALGCKTITTMS